jgi:hypothetical protein
VLIGIGALVAVWCERAADQAVVPAPLQQPQPPQPTPLLQEPVPEPAWVTVDDPDGLAAVPEDCRALRLWPRGAHEVAGLARLKQLAHLDLGLAVAEGEKPQLDEGILRAVGGLATLRELRLDHRIEVEPSWLQALEALPVLEALRLRFVPLDDAGAARLARLPSLRRLDLAFDGVLGDAGLAAIAALPDLRELSLRACGALTTDGLAVLGKASRLEVLDLSCVTGIGSGVPRALAGGRPMPPALLQRAEAMMLAEMTQAAVPGRGVTDAVLQELGRLERLRELRLQGCPSITPWGVSVVAGRNLRVLDLYLRDGAFAPFVEALPPTLEELGLACCRTLSDADLEAVGVRLPLLQKIDLTQCTAVGDAGLEQLLQRCAIRELKLVGCKGLTAKTLPVLLAHKALRKLDVTGLRWVDAAAEEQLRALPELQVECRRGGFVMATPK